MKTQTSFGGAIVELKVSSETDETLLDPKIAPTTQAFLELYRLALAYGEGEAFSRGFDAFLDEMLIFFEDRYIASSTKGDLVNEMEEFMNQKYRKGEE